MTDSPEHLIPTLPLFRGFSPLSARSLIERGTLRRIPAGEVLFREGDVSDSVLLILSGSLEVFTTREQKDFLLAEPGPGTVVGELSVLCASPRWAGLRTRSEATVLEWTPDEFRRLLIGNPAFSQRIFSEALRLLVQKERELITALVATNGTAG